jgi:hypothetical protein
LVFGQRKRSGGAIGLPPCSQGTDGLKITPVGEGGNIPPRYSPVASKLESPEIYVRVRATAHDQRKEPRGRCCRPSAHTQYARKLCRALPSRTPAQPQPGAPETPLSFRGVRFGEWHENRVRLFLRIRHIRNAVRLASFRQRDPRISQACVMFPLLGVVCFLRQCFALGRRFPCGLALGSHLVASISVRAPPRPIIAPGEL